MKLTVEQTDNGRLLCVDGVPLPMQSKLTLVSEVGEKPRVIVEFINDGEHLKVTGDKKVYYT